MLGWAVIEAVIYEKQKERERRQKISFKDFESFAYICMTMITMKCKTEADSLLCKNSPFFLLRNLTKTHTIDMFPGKNCIRVYRCSPVYREWGARADHQFASKMSI